MHAFERNAARKLSRKTPELFPSSRRSLRLSRAITRVAASVHIAMNEKRAAKQFEGKKKRGETQRGVGGGRREEEQRQKRERRKRGEKKTDEEETAIVKTARQ